MNDLTYRAAGYRTGSFVLILLLFAPLIAQAQDCAEEYEQAEQFYNFGQFDDSIELLNQCLQREGLSNEAMGRIYRLKGLNFIGKGLQADARNAVRALLDAFPEYSADSNADHPMLVQLVEEERQRIEAAEAASQPTTQVIEPQQRKKKNNTWLWVGLGVAAAAGAAVITVGPGGSDPDPTPPGPPVIDDPPPFPGN